MAKTPAQQAAMIVREAERRFVWLAARLIGEQTSTARADEVLRQYEARFPAIEPPE